MLNAVFEASFRTDRSPLLTKVFETNIYLEMREGGRKEGSSRFVPKIKAGGATVNVERRVSSTKGTRMELDGSDLRTVPERKPDFPQKDFEMDLGSFELM